LGLDEIEPRGPDSREQARDLLVLNRRRAIGEKPTTPVVGAERLREAARPDLNASIADRPEPDSIAGERMKERAELFGRAAFPVEEHVHADRLLARRGAPARARRGRGAPRGAAVVSRLQFLRTLPDPRHDGFGELPRPNLLPREPFGEDVVGVNPVL